MKKNAHLWTHIVLDLEGCPKPKVEKVPEVRKILQQTAREAELSVISENFHQFKPTGVTGVLLLKESHISIHTWPEHNIAAIDIFCCNKKKASKAYRSALKQFKALKVKKKVVLR